MPTTYYLSTIKGQTPCQVRAPNEFLDIPSMCKTYTNPEEAADATVLLFITMMADRFAGLEIPIYWVNPGVCPNCQGKPQPEIKPQDNEDNQNQNQNPEDPQASNNMRSNTVDDNHKAISEVMEERLVNHPLTEQEKEVLMDSEV